MIIKEIYIDGFGVWHDWPLTGLKKGINIIVGKNEAGKSTLQKFIRFTLFGYPHRNEERNGPLKGGVHGGRIRCLLSSGDEVIFERFSGRGQGEIKLEYHGESSVNSALWMQLLGNATQDLYNNVYAFSLDELVKLDSLKTSGVEDKLFSVGLGLGNTSIGSIESSLVNLVQALYTPRGSIQFLPKLLAEFSQKKDNVLEIQKELPKYEKLSGEIESIQQQIGEINKTLPALRLNYSKLKNYLACYDSFVEVENINKGLDLLPTKQGYPQNGIEQLNRLEENENLMIKKIKELERGNGAVKGLDELERVLGEITIQKDLLSLQKKITTLVNNLALYKQAIIDRSDDSNKIKRVSESIRYQLQTIDSSWSVNNILKFNNTILHKDKIASFKLGRDEIDKKKIKLEAEEATVKATRPSINIVGIAVTISITLIVLSIAVLLYKQYLPAVVLAVVALVVFLRKGKYTSNEDPLFRIRQDLKDLQDKEDLAWQKNYEHYLVSEFGFNGTFSTEAVLIILNTIDSLKKDIAYKNELETRQENERSPFISSYEKEASTLRSFLGEQEFDSNVEELILQVSAKFNAVQSKTAYKSRLEESIQEKKKILEQAQLELNDIRGQINILLDGIYASSKEQYRVKYKENEQVNQLLESKRLAIQTIDKIAGINAYEEVSKFLLSNDKIILEESIKEHDSNINRIENRVQELNSLAGSKITERNQIEGESGLAMQMTELEMLREKINQGYKNWAAGKVALKILGIVKAKYEKERQPVVIKNSGRYFSTMTKGKYGRISASLDEKEVRVYDAMEAGKRIEQLSRGTKEQLLISLRLGFIEQYELQSEPLPIIADEIFVNFDPARLKETARLLHVFAQTRQVLIFTCHPLTLDCFEGMEVNAIRL